MGGRPASGCLEQGWRGVVGVFHDVREFVVPVALELIFCKMEILYCCLGKAVAKRGGRQDLGSKGFVGGIEIIVESIILLADAMDVVIGPCLGVRPVKQAQTAGSKSVVETTLQDETQPPFGFFQQTFGQKGMSAFVVEIGLEK